MSYKMSYINCIALSKFGLLSFLTISSLRAENNPSSSLPQVSGKREALQKHLWTE